MSRPSNTFDPDAASVEAHPTAAPPPGDPPVAPDLGRLHPVPRDHYEILAEFARGGLGRVLRARDRRIDRIVAIKETLRVSPALHARFAREALVTAHLQHPAIVPVYEVGRWAEGGQPFYAMKLVAGASLDDALGRCRSFTDRLALLPAAIAVADALAYAHGQRVIHRDLKPANVLLGDFGETVVIDWGLAKCLDQTDLPGTDDELVDPASGLTLAGAVLGTPGYMAPEQARGEAVDARVDVFALGAMLYEILGGVRPYAEASGIAAIVDRTLAGPPRPLASLAPDAPAELVAIVRRAMAHRPDDRYPTARELADDLRRFQTGQLVAAHRYTPGELLGRWVRRHRGVVAASTVAALLLAGGGVVSVVGIRAARDRALDAQALAEDRLVTLYAETARRMLTEGDPQRSLPYLAEALASGRAGPEVAFLAGRAAAALGGAGPVMIGHVAPVLYVGWSPDGTEILSSGADLFVGRWAAADGARRSLEAWGLAAVWTPDGRRIVSVEADGGLVTRTAKGEVERRVRFLRPDGVEDTARRLLPSPDGRFVAAIGQEGGLLWWEVDSGRVAGSVLATRGRALVLAWTPDGARILAAGDDGAVRAWSTADGSLRSTWTVDTGSVPSLVVSPDGTLAAAGGAGGDIWLLDLAGGPRSRPLLGHTGPVADLAFDATGTRLASVSSDRSLRVWDVGPTPTLRGVATAQGGLQLVVWAGDRLLTTDDGGALELWDAAARRLARRVGHTAPVGALALSPDGRTVATASLDQTVRRWTVDAPGAATRLDLQGADAPKGTLGADGTALLVGSDGVARTFGPTGAPGPRLVGHTGAVVSVARGAERFATGGVDGTVRTWVAATGAPLLNLPAAGPRVRWVGFSPDGASLLSVEADGAARLRDAATGAVRATLHSSFGAIRSAAFSPDGHHLVTPSEGAGATLWDVATGAALAEVPVLATEAIAASWTPDGRYFLLTAEAPEVTVHDATTGALHLTLSGHTGGPVAAAVVSPDGTTALTAGFDGTARTWDLETGALRLTVGDGTTPVVAAAFRPDGTLFVTTGAGRVDAWSSHSGQHLVSWTEVPEDPVSLSFTPDGRRLLVVGLTGAPAVLDTADWAGDGAALQQAVACQVPWRLDGGVLVASFPVSRLCR